MGKLAGMAAAIKQSVADKHSAFVADIAETTTSMEGAKATLTTEVTAAITAINTAEGEAHAARVAAESELKADKAAIVEALKTEDVVDGVIKSLLEVQAAHEAYKAKYGVDLSTTAAHQSAKVAAYETARGSVVEFQSAFAGSLEGGK
jgi:hypothetical protein